MQNELKEAGMASVHTAMEDHPEETSTVSLLG
jgi:hypothetical protein